MNVCHCTNQCPGCGQCCRIDCGCRRTAQGWRVTPGTVTTPMPPIQVGEIRLTPTPPLTEEQVRKIVREALAEALAELEVLHEPDGSACRNHPDRLAVAIDRDGNGICQECTG